MQTVQRVDAGGTLRPVRRMPDGRLIVDAYTTRVGVFEYPKNGRIVRELRHPDDVFDRVSMDTFAHLPVTNRHPSKMLTAKTARTHMVGASGERVERDGDYMRQTLMIADAELIEAMERGDQVEISNGYYCDLEERPGVDPVYGHYDVRQRNIRGNHHAVVERGRAGSTVRARMDEAETLAEPAIEKTDLHWSGGRAILLNMADHEAQARALNNRIKELETQVEKLDGELKTETARADAAHGKLEVAEKKIGDLEAAAQSRQDAVQSEALSREKKRADDAEALVRNFDARFDAAVAARSKLMTRAVTIHGPSYRMDDMSDRQIRVETIKKLDSTVDVGDAVPDGKIEGLFDALVDGHLKNARQMAEISAHFDAGDEPTEKKTDKNPTAPTRGRRDQWKDPLPSTVRFRNAKEN